jgi:hypothetical protein
MKPNRFAALTRNLVWPAVVAAVLAISSVAAALLGSENLAVSLGLAGVTFAVLTPRNY